ncbi:MAG: methylated-DNA--[protein]-cysteine S-methyltransferase [Flavobacteriales bacterium]|nr:methylated-DNA--[protein]-cysteine S-methyltransferase [Flavobacteriales bacterium]
MPKPSAARVTAGDPELFQLFHAVVLDTPIGKFYIESDGEVITRSGFDPMKLRHAKPPMVLKEAGRQAAAYFNGKLKKFELPLQRLGSPFQRLEWSVLEDIPYGEARTYQDLAHRIGGKAVARTVGNACASNPLLIIVPCHRVMAKNGLLTGYAGGLWRKKWLLEHEGVLAQELF